MIKFPKNKEENTIFGPYSQIVQINNLFFTSGQIPVNQKNKCIPNTISEQTKLVLQNIKKLLINQNLTIKNIIKITIFTTKLDLIKDINLTYKNFFDLYTTNYPVRSCIGVNQLPKNVFIEMEAIAYKE